jgi:DNA-binding cell septation regulator SpoVG
MLIWWSMLRFCHHLQILTSDLFSNRCATRELLVITTTNEFFIPTRHTTTTDTTTTDTTKPIETDVRCSITSTGGFNGGFYSKT